MLNLCYWCLFTMHTEKAQLISCFVNDYCIPTTLFKTISKLKSNSFNVYSNRTLEAVILLFTNCSFERKKVWYDPMCFIVVCLSISLFLSLSLCCHQLPLIRKLRTHALRIFHSSIIIHTYMHKQTYIDLNLPKQVITD